MGILRENYLTRNNRGERAAQWLAACHRGRHAAPVTGDIQRTALMVLDMQGFFLQPAAHAYVPSAAAIIPPIAALTDMFYRKGGIVVFTRHISANNPHDPMRRRWPHAMDAADPFSAISPQLDTTRGNVLIKHAFSAFFNTDLEEQLTTKGITRLIITGVMTHLCCDTTARDAFMRGFDVLFAIDGTATYTQALHVGTLQALAHGFATCVTCQEVLG